MIWLIGNKGMLGSDVEKLLQAENLTYWASGRDVDITDYKVLEKFSRDKNVEWLINCSAYTRVDEAEIEKEEAFRINQGGVRNMVLLCLKKQARLIHISTDYVFDGVRSNREFYIEEDEPNPLNVYGKSKLAGEQEIQKFLESYFIIRTAWLYGKNGPNYVKTMLRLFNEKGLIEVVNDQCGSPTYSKDLAQVIIDIVKKKSNYFGIYHYTNEGQTSWFNFAREIYIKAKKLGLLDKEKEVKFIPVSTENYLTLAKRPKNTILCKDKIKQTFNLEIRTWSEALEEFLHNLLFQVE